MLKEISKKWWVLLLNGIFAIIFAIIAFTRPGMMLLSFAIVFGVYCIADGITMIGASVARGKSGESWGHLLFNGIISLIAGGFSLLWPGITAFTLFLLIAVWAILRGITEIFAAIRLRKVISHEWLLVLSGFISILFGFYLIARPRAGVVTVIWIIGLFAVVHGILLVALSFKLHKLGRIEYPSAI